MNGPRLTRREAAPDPSALQATVLWAYYGLVREGRRGEHIGSAEILAWLDKHLPDEPTPSLSLVQKVLLEHGAAHRREGRPRTDTTAPIDAPPLCAVRSTPPRVREPK